MFKGYFFLCFFIYFQNSFSSLNFLKEKSCKIVSFLWAFAKPVNPIKHYKFFLMQVGGYYFAYKFFSVLYKFYSMKNRVYDFNWLCEYYSERFDCFNKKSKIPFIFF
jgi:hypothetical protein